MDYQEWAGCRQDFSACPVAGKTSNRDRGGTPCWPFGRLRDTEGTENGDSGRHTRPSKVVMIRSMTGYSKVHKDEPDFSLSVSVKSINHRFLDLQVRMPAALDGLEPTFRRRLKEKITRGHVEVTVSLNTVEPAEIRLDDQLLKAYAAACKKLSEGYGFSGAPDPIALLRIPGVVGTSNGDLPPELMERIAGALAASEAECLDRLNEMREREGAALEKDLRERLAHLLSLAKTVEDLARKVPSLYQQRLENRLRELLNAMDMDPSRVAQEVAFLASRSDITEELIRFRSHLEQMDQLFAQADDLGKKFDFLLQELNREANTLLSKTTDVPSVGREISRLAIEMKTEIEKIREQVQNIE
jgi:uncharacterized protein (TIGR00255 family)